MKTAVKSLLGAVLMAGAVLFPCAAASAQEDLPAPVRDGGYRKKPDPRTLARLGKANFADRNYNAAIRYWSKAKELEPGLADEMDRNLGMAYAGRGHQLYLDGDPCGARDDLERALGLEWYADQTESRFETADRDCRKRGGAAPPVALPVKAVIPRTIYAASSSRVPALPSGKRPAPSAGDYPYPGAPVREEIRRVPDRSSPFASLQREPPPPAGAADQMARQLLLSALSAIPLVYVAFSPQFRSMSWGQIAGVTAGLFLIKVLFGMKFFAAVSWLLGVSLPLKHYWEKHFSANRLVIRPREAEILSAPGPAPSPARPAQPAPGPAPAPPVPEPPALSAQSRPSLRKVDALMEQGKYKKALEAFVVKAPGQLSEADRVNLFEIHLHLGNFDRAAGLFPQIKDAAPLKANISRYKSLTALCYELKQTELARQASRGLFSALKATRVADGNNAGLYYGFARSCEDNGDAELARGIYRHLIEAGFEGYKDVFARHEQLKVKSAPPPPPARELPARQPARPALPASGLTTLAGRYELKRGIGEGGMGVVYEGWDRELTRRVAVKKMHSWLKSSAQEYERFKYEAKIVGRLRHPNIVGVHSIIEQEDEIYLVFDYVDGKTLAEILKVKKRFPVEECRDIFSGVCSAVHYAHKSNIIHRDLKPANIMLDVSGYAYVMDFGLASELRDSLSRVTHQTTSGTPAYMAPEQHAGVVKRESDIYAMGVCLYEMLTGELPFRGQDPLKLKRLKDYREVSAMLPWLPAGVDDLLSRALEPEPSQRMADALDFLDALKKL